MSISFIDSDFINRFKKNKGAMIGLSVIIFFSIIALFAPFLTSFESDQINQGALRLAPFSSFADNFYLLGTDDLGRDLYTRLVYGSRISLFIGFTVVIFSLTIGSLLGLFAGYFGGYTDKIIMRFVDILMAFPSILLAIVVVAILGPGLINSIIAVGVVALPSFIRVVRASVLAEKQKEYVMASVSFGASHFRIMFIEILPNCLAPMIVQATLGFSDGILNAAALGFLGLGAQAPTPEWGMMLADSRAYIEVSPWLVTLPGLCILFCVLGFNILGDGLRDTLDPKLKR
jgi:peptide/nickel transport system permease protein/dipeptide transport system permease protein